MKKYLMVQAIALALAGPASAGDISSTMATESPGCPVKFEVENQTPCFFFGGYQLSLGVRYDQCRLRVSTQNSGHADFEETGIDRRNSKFKRDFDHRSFSVSLDHFWNDYLFTYTTLASNSWLLRKVDSEATDNIRSLDVGFGAGFQYFFCKHLFAQLSCQINYRGRKSTVIEGEKYTLPQYDYTPGLRLGIRF
jgi:hypothetical protein